VAQDYAEAVKYYLKAAELGNSGAQFNLGTLYATGQGTAQDYEQAVYWYQKAAEQGNTNAQYNLGNLYYNGEGVEQDYAKAHLYFNLASANGDEQGQNCLNMVAEKMTPVQIAEAQQLASEWMNEH